MTRAACLSPPRRTRAPRMDSAALAPRALLSRDARQAVACERAVEYLGRGRETLRKGRKPSALGGLGQGAFSLRCQATPSGASVAVISHTLRRTAGSASACAECSAAGTIHLGGRVQTAARLRRREPRHDHGPGLLTCAFTWGERWDSNPRHPGPQQGIRARRTRDCRHNGRSARLSEPEKPHLTPPRQARPLPFRSQNRTASQGWPPRIQPGRSGACGARCAR